MGGLPATTERAGVGASIEPGWLGEARFDFFFIGGIAAIAILSGIAVAIQPALFLPILFFDLWLLGYHHVVSTYTRLCFDRESFARHRLLIFALLPAVVAAVALIAAMAGLWMLTTIYLYWQWFHYTRQSYGVAQAYRRAAGGIAENERLSHAVFYLVPLWGILHRAHQAPDLFLGLEVRHPPVPGYAVDIVGVLAILGMLWWIATRIRMYRSGTLALGHTLFVLSHFAVFYTGYILIESINAGWIALNVWHNAQYIAFVWLQNNRRFRDGIDPGARFLSWLSQRRNVAVYLGVCFGISTAVYLGLQWTVASVGALVFVYQAINFHHYIVDAIIWRRPRRPAPSAA